MPTSWVKKALKVGAADKPSAPRGHYVHIQRDFWRVSRLSCDDTPLDSFARLNSATRRIKKDGVIDRRFLLLDAGSRLAVNQLNEVKGLTDMADYV